MNLKNLLQNSDAYYKDNEYYELFSKSEDYPGLITSYLKEEASNKTILDAGCGTGKFLEELENVSKKYIGIDLSSNQIETAKSKVKKKSTTLIVSNLSYIDIPSNSIDLIVCTWVLGTIIDLNERDKAINELKRVLNNNGKIILIENAENSEFEKIRGRDKDSRTKDYNNYLISKGFRIDKEFNSYFKFKSKEDAIKCFDVIYGKAVSSKISSDTIEHKIVSFIFEKN